MRAFIVSAWILLMVTGLAKFITAFGSAHVLVYPEPISGIKFRTVFFTVGLLELAIAFFCFFGKRVDIQTGVLVWLSTIFVLYRLSLSWLGQKPCHCLGNLTEALHIPSHTADTVMKIVLAYILLGSYAVLFGLWRKRRKLE
jgi:hypothetical protein